MVSRFAKLAVVILALGATTPAIAQIDASNNFEAYSAVLGAGKNAALVRQLRHVPSVGVITVRGSGNSFFGGEDGSDILTIADNNGAAVDALRHALSANPVTRTALSANGVNIGTVIGVQVGSSGSLRVFTNY